MIRNKKTLMYGGGDRMKIDRRRMLIDYIQPNEKQCLLFEMSDS